jgi:hypothetical protein
MRALLLVALVCVPLMADDEAGNSPHVATSEYGRCYAKSVPAERYGNDGTTQVFTVTEEEDLLVHTYDWFSWTIHLVCNASDSKRPTGIAAVSTGPWARGHEASADVLAVAFHFDGETVREYSTLEIAGTPANVSQSVSHYTVIEAVLGFRWVRSNEYVFEVRTVDGRLLAFDPITGDRLDQVE